MALPNKRPAPRREFDTTGMEAAEMVDPALISGVTVVMWLVSVAGGIYAFRSLEDDSVDHETVVERVRLHTMIAPVTGLLIVTWYLRTLGVVLT